MRIQTLILSLLFCVASAFAKDVITKTDGSKIDAKVEEITETVIKYRKASNPTGPAYTIPISSVATVLYENGDIDNFNASKNTNSVSSLQHNSPSDVDLMRLADSQLYDNQSENASDAELIRMMKMETPYEQLEKKAKFYKKIALIGAGAFVGVGVITGIVLYCADGFSGDPGFKWILYGCGGGIGVGGLWYLGLNLQANTVMKQAREIQSYSATIFENEIMQFGNNSLTAGINIMGNRMVNSHSLGLSLGFNF